MLECVLQLTRSVLALRNVTVMSHAIRAADAVLGTEIPSGSTTIFCSGESEISP